MIDFPTGIPDCDSHSPALLDLFISSDASICSAMAFPALGNCDHVIASVSIDVPSNSQQNAPVLSRNLWLFSCWLGWSLWSFEGCSMGEYLYHVSADASEFYEWVQVRIDVYIPDRIYQVKPHSSLWFSAAFAAAIVHRNHLSVLSTE